MDPGVDSEVELEHQTRRKRSRCIQILDPFSIDFDVSVSIFGFLGGSWGSLKRVLWGGFFGDPEPKKNPKTPQIF